MKEVVKVSLSGIAFTFDQDAYQVMDTYIKRLNAGYAKNPDRAEIVGDIESRIVELILEHQESTVVVGKELVDSIVGQLGYPDDLDESDGASPSTERLARRLYRNMDGAKLGGVCNGLGTYFNTDPVWVRVGFFAPLLLCILFEVIPFLNGLSELFASLWGIFFLLYFILWICIPQARTPRQKLEMRGEKVTASSIHNTFAEEAASVNSSPKSQKTASVWADLAYGLGRFIQFFFKALLVLIGIICGVTMLGICVGIIGLIFGASWVALPFVGALEGVLVGISPIGYIILAMVTVLMFLVLVCYLAFTLVFNRKTNRKGLSVLGIIFLLLFVWLCVITARNTPNWHTIENRIEDSFADWDDYDDLDDFDWQIQLNSVNDWTKIGASQLKKLDFDDDTAQRIEEALSDGGKVSISVDGSRERVVIKTDEESIEIIQDGKDNRRVSIRLNSDKSEADKSDNTNDAQNNDDAESAAKTEQSSEK
ncbi:MAG: PspC domain-containing protein [Tidjanibacter sp.]|nr:PspC domain-containing protein [Tidjanibacter sp.]